MNNPVEKFIAGRAAKLPQKARTRSGIQYSPQETLWCFRDGVTQLSLSFDLIPIACTPLIHGIKFTLIWYLEHRASSTVSQYFSGLVAFLRAVARERTEPISQITPTDVLAYKMLSYESQFALAAIRPFLKQWAALGAPGVGQDVANLLGQLKLKQSPVGVAVATLDPEKGPFTDLEFEAIQMAVNDAYARRKMDTETFVLSYLFMAIGARPVQFAAMKCCDLIAPEKGSDGDYVLNVPRAKQGDQLVRGEFTPRLIATQVGKALQGHVQEVRARFKGTMDADQFPMFPQSRETEYSNAPGFEFHRTSGALSMNLIRAFQRLHVPTERLDGRAIPVTPVRFRRTFATRAAEEGLPLLVIAELMDHADTRHVRVYAGLTTRIRAQFSRKIAVQMAPIVEMLTGRVIQNEAAATRPDASSRVIDLRVDQSGAGMGSCGTHARCLFDKPVSCYGCHSFEPWLDGPHEAMFDYMINRRNYLMKTADARIASINDRAIVGCAQVILRVRAIRNEQKLDG